MSYSEKTYVKENKKSKRKKRKDSEEPASEKNFSFISCYDKDFMQRYHCKNIPLKIFFFTVNRTSLKWLKRIITVVFFSKYIFLKGLSKSIFKKIYICMFEREYGINAY